MTIAMIGVILNILKKTNSFYYLTVNLTMYLFMYPISYVFIYVFYISIYLPLLLTTTVMV